MTPSNVGPYRIERRLSWTPDGSTFLGVDDATSKRVVLERVSQHRAGMQRQRDLLQQLTHPLLPEFVGVLEDDEQPYLVTSFIEGEDLGAARRRGLRFTESEVVKILREVAEVLEYLHRLLPPVVHGDLKPQHILRGVDGRYYVLNCWRTAARNQGEWQEETVGTFGYMAPEQFDCESRAVPATDSYGLGATMIALLTDREPEDLPRRGHGIDVRRALGVGVSDPLVELLQSLLEHDIQRRPTSLLPLLERLESRRGEGASVSVRPSMDAALPAVAPTAHSDGASSQALHWADSAHAAGGSVLMVGMISAGRIPGYLADMDVLSRWFYTVVATFHPIVPLLVFGSAISVGRSLERNRAPWHAWLALFLTVPLALVVFVGADLAASDRKMRALYVLGLALGGVVCMSPCLYAMLIVLPACVARGIVRWGLRCLRTSQP